MLLMLIIAYCFRKKISVWFPVWISLFPVCRCEMCAGYSKQEKKQTVISPPPHISRERVIRSAVNLAFQKRNNHD